MVRTYQPRNPYIRRSKLTADISMGICYNYLANVQLKVIAESYSTSEPTVHRLISRFQDRLARDTELLAILCGRLVDADETLQNHAELIAWVAGAESAAVEDLSKCIYQCPIAQEMDAYTARAYARSAHSEIDYLGGMQPMTSPPGSTFHFRERFCESCPNACRLCGDPMIINTMSFDEILSPNLKIHFQQHLPAAIVRSCVKWRVIKAVRENKIYEHADLSCFEDYYDIRHYIMEMWFRSALVHLERNPL